MLLNQLMMTHPSTQDGSIAPTLLVFSHLRWHFVTQRPQHLMVRAARSRRVIYWEEPYVYTASQVPDGLPTEGRLEEIRVERQPNVLVLRPHLREGDDLETAQRTLLDSFLRSHRISRYDAWFYTPMALGFARHLTPEVTVFDAMDELSAFAGAPPRLLQRERELFGLADVVFTGGHSLYKHKRSQHGNVHAFPSSIEVEHFAAARQGQPEPPDQAGIPHPRVGFYGVLDERLDVTLLQRLAELRPAMHFVLLGPVVKIDESTLPHASNVHYLGGKSYAELPAYLAGWNAAMMPFARNESTRFISPTKTPEFLAAGKRVVSTPIFDVVYDYGNAGLVAIADDAESFATKIDAALAAGEDVEWRRKVERKLAGGSWDTTWAAMHTQMEKIRMQKNQIKSLGPDVPMEVVKLRMAVSPRENFDFIVVGAGFAGTVLAERLAQGSAKRVLVVDRRPHIAGNAFDYLNEDGLLVHLYGPHIFHTQSEKVFTYLSQFTEWRSYEHKVLAEVDGKRVPIPINIDTLNQLYDLELDAEGMKAFLAERVESRPEIRTSEDIVVSRVGRELYEKFFRNYTRKQWGVDPSELDASVAGRIPVRFNHDDRYFADEFQVMPLEGYTRMFERMLDHPRITVRLSTDYREIMEHHPRAKVVFTGPIDEFFDYRFGRLPYRSLRFEHETLNVEQMQPVGVVNFPNEHAYTRRTEFKHLTGQKSPKTSVVYEYPQTEGDPYYPIPRPENAALYERYRELADATPGVYFCGRLANYKYFNMDQVVAQALHLYRNIADEQLRSADMPKLGSTSVSGLRGQGIIEVAAPKSGAMEGAS